MLVEIFYIFWVQLVPVTQKGRYIFVIYELLLICSLEFEKASDFEA